MGVINNNILILVWSKPFIGKNGGMFVRNEWSVCSQCFLHLCCSCRWSSVLQHEPARPQADRTHGGRIAAVSPAALSLGSDFHALQPAERRTLLQSEPRYCSHYSELMSSRTFVQLIRFHLFMYIMDPATFFLTFVFDTPSYLCFTTFILFCSNISHIRFLMIMCS